MRKGNCTNETSSPRISPHSLVADQRPCLLPGNWANHHFSWASTKEREGTPPTVSAQGFKLRLLVNKDFPLENPSGDVTSFGELSTGVGTEPDQNTYLVLPSNPGGPEPGRDYGRHFLFQGHENGANMAYVTRINLDVHDRAHKITLLTPTGADGTTGFSFIDGSTYDQFTKTLLLPRKTAPAAEFLKSPTRGRRKFARWTAFWERRDAGNSSVTIVAT